MTKPLNVILAFDDARTEDFHAHPEAFLSVPDRKTEKDIWNALKKLGHQVSLLPVYEDVPFILSEIDRFKPDIAFNQVEQFRGDAFQERNFVGLLEMLQVPYTGTNVSGLLLSKNKSLAKKIMRHHHIKTPEFTTLLLGKKITVPAKMRYPMIVKPLREDASYGISQKSLVHDISSLEKRVQFIFESMKQDVLVEEYIVGREIYSAILGNQRIQVLPPREMIFEHQTDNDQKIATFKAKWDDDYRKKWGIRNIFPNDLSPAVLKKIESESRRTFKALSLQGYARLDLRITDSGDVVCLEANPNPHLARGEDFAMAAQKTGLSYEELIQKIVQLGLNWKH